MSPTVMPVDKTLGEAAALSPHLDYSVDVDASAPTPEWEARDADLPPLPQKLTPAQAARIAEIFDYLHQGLTSACEKIQANDDATEIRLPYSEWQKIQAVQMLLARYHRAVAEPETLFE
jgi:hypothetical protein